MQMISTLQARVTYLLARSRREDGAVATEYGLLLFLVALAIILALGALAAALVGVFNSGATELGGVTG
jgi:Flp pilus assembly pilin Flp